MPGTALSQELCSRIVDYVATGRRSDLAALCLVSKAFQKEAEPRLYAFIALGDHRRVFFVCRAIIQSERRASFVRAFWFSHAFAGREPPAPLPHAFWAHIQNALVHMPNLENLVLFDHLHQNSWIFDSHAEFKFQLKETKLRFRWDEKLIRFLQGQPKLRSLQIVDFADPETEGTIPLPNLRCFEGSFAAAQQLLSSPLTNIQISVDKASIPFLAHLPATLLGLGLLELPEEKSTPVIAMIARSCPNLVHLGGLFLPVLKRHQFIDHLMQLKYLRSIELDISSWTPVVVLAAQRAVAAELKTFCPSIRHVIFWHEHTKFRWWYQPSDTALWTHRMEHNQHRSHGQHWLHTYTPPTAH